MDLKAKGFNPFQSVLSMITLTEVGFNIVTVPHIKKRKEKTLIVFWTNVIVCLFPSFSPHSSPPLMASMFGDMLTGCL